jgi:hypothetical protein
MSDTIAAEFFTARSPDTIAANLDDVAACTSTGPSTRQEARRGRGTRKADPQPVLTRAGRAGDLP